MANYYIAPESSFDATADAIRAKTGSQASIEWTEDGFADAIEDIQTGVNLDDFMARTAPTGAVSLPTVTKLYGYSFYQHDLITSISAPSITRLGAYDFYHCDNLENVYMPELLYASKIDKADGEFVNSDDCYAFARSHNLGTIHLPKLLQSSKGLFYQVGYDLSSSNYKCIIVLPSITMLGHSSCRQGKFRAIDLGPNLTSLNNDAFYSATVDVLILRSTTLVSAANRDAVRHIKNLYVPSALVADYATASNWSTDAATRTVTAIEGSQYETHYADGTLIPT